MEVPAWLPGWTVWIWKLIRFSMCVKTTSCKLCRLQVFPLARWYFFLYSHASLSLLLSHHTVAFLHFLMSSGFFLSLSLWLFPAVSTQCVFSGAGSLKLLAIKRLMNVIPVTLALLRANMKGGWNLKLTEKFDKLKDSDMGMSPLHSATFRTAIVNAYLSSYNLRIAVESKCFFFWSFSGGTFVPAACWADELWLCGACCSSASPALLCVAAGRRTASCCRRPSDGRQWKAIVGNHCAAYTYCPVISSPLGMALFFCFCFVLFRFSSLSSCFFADISHNRSFD